MTPTPEQVAQWAREEGIEISAPAELPAAFRVNVRRLSDLHRLVTRAMAEQAEADAKRLCEASALLLAPRRTNQVDRHVAYVLESHAEAIRANAPKVTT